jgi:hypothetical protein
MLWLKAWMETRWKAAWMLFAGALIVLAEAGKAPTGLLAIGVLFAAVVTIFLAGTGIETASTRPGESAKGGEGSKLFTLSLPVTRARLFWVRTVTGLLEAGALLLLLAVAAWLVFPPLAGNADDALGTLAVIVSFSVAVYAVSACLATFCDEGWRVRLSVLAVAGLFFLSASRRFPPAIHIFRSLVFESPLVTHRMPWDAIVAACVLAVVFFAATLTIIQKRDY